MLLDDLERDRQAHAGALADRLGGEERVEDLRHHVLRDAAAVVLDLDAHRLVVLHRRAQRDDARPWPLGHRVNGVVSNMPEFARAFSCKADAPMVRKNACRVW